MNRFDARLDNASWTFRREGDASIVSVVRRMDYSANIGAGGVIEFPLAVGIWAGDWRSGALSVKYSARTAWAVGASVDVIVQNIAIEPEEPQTTFVEASAIPVAVSSWLQATAGTNRLETVALTTPIGPQLRVVLRASQAASPGIIGVTVTVDLIGRTN